MSRIGRVLAWVLVWPVGAYLSLRHAARKREAKEARRAADRLRSESGPSNPTAVRDIADMLAAHEGLTKREQLLITAAAMQHVHAGVSPYEAVRRALDERGLTPDPVSRG